MVSLKKTYLLFSLVSLLSTSVFAQCDNPNDYAALYALYNNADGDNWLHNNNWDVSAIPLPDDLDMEDWYGISCSGGRVTEVKLNNNFLDGTIPIQLGNLTNLEYLYLNSNQLSGTIPVQLANLNNLEYLNLNSNQLTGTIPSQLSNLTNLKILLLYLNQLTGSIPTQLSNLTNLEKLYLWGNELTGAIPSQLSNLANLEYLHLDQNQLTGTIPVQLGNLVNLKSLGLAENQLTGTIPSQLGNLANLNWLYLNDNKLEDVIPTQLGNLVNLNSLYLNDNKLEGVIPTQLGHLSNISTIELNDNKLTGGIPVNFNQLIWLSNFNISNNLLSGCYHGALKDTPLLGGFSDADISAGNNFAADWEDFWLLGSGDCCSTNIWNGGEDSNWETPGNWNKLEVPSSCQNIIISGVGAIININSVTATAASISIVNGNTLNIEAGAVLTIDGVMNDLSTHGINVSGNGAILNNMGSIVCMNSKKRGLNLNFGGVFNNSGSLEIDDYNVHVPAADSGIDVSDMGQMTNTGSIMITSSVSNTDTDGISCKSNGNFSNSGSINISNIQGLNSEGISNEAAFTNEAGGTVSINTVGNSNGLLNATAAAQFINNGSISTTNTFAAGLRNTGGATFGGSGAVSMDNFDNAANISPGNSPGALTLNGNFSNTGTYVVEVNSKAGIGVGHDHLQVNGDISLSETINITNNSPGGTLLDDDKFILLSYTGTRTGDFTAVKLDLFPVGWVVKTDASFCGKCIVVHGPAAILPVVLTSFKAKKQGEEVKLSWSVASETNNKGFEVEHSSNGKDWRKIDWIAGNGTSNTANDYAFLHQQPRNGYNYYRLKQIDFDGQFEYSNIVSINFGTEHAVTVYPNPAKEVLFISGENLNNAVVEILNSQGQKMSATILNQNQKEASLDISRLKTGIYMLSIITKDGQRVSKQVLITQN